jgi:hypothetical protein
VACKGRWKKRRHERKLDFAREEAQNFRLRSDAARIAGMTTERASGCQ